MDENSEMHSLTTSDVDRASRAAACKLDITYIYAHIHLTDLGTWYAMILLKMPEMT